MDSQALLVGKSAVQAYTDVGYAPSRQHAHHLATKGYIVARLAELRAPVVKAVQVTLERHLRDLKVLRDTAAEAGQYGAAITAEVNRGKAAGLYVERRSSRNERLQHRQKHMRRLDSQHRRQRNGSYA